MVGYCYVCKIGQGEEDNVSIHKLPKDEKTRANWFTFIGYETGPNSGICSKHFQESDFIYKVHGANIRRFLKPGACPSLLQYRQSNEKNTKIVYEQNTNNCISSQDHDTNNCTSSGDHNTKDCVLSKDHDINDCTSSGDHDTNDCTSSGDHDTNDCTSNGDHDTKSDIIVNTSIKLNDISYETIKIEGVTIEEVSSMVKIPLNSKTDNPLIGKKRYNTPRYIGDLRPEDFNSYECWSVFRRYLTETRKKLKRLKNENICLSNKVAKLQVIIDHFKEKGLICSEDRDCFIESTKEITT